MMLQDMWYYSKGGMQAGPVSQEELCALAKIGGVLPSDLVWREGMANWKPLALVPELMFHAGETTPVSSSAVLSDSSPEGGHIPLPQPPAFHGNYLAPKMPTYIWQSVLALVISAGMMMVICIPIGMPFAIVALVYASKVEGLRLHGSLVEAASASRSAKIWMIISYVLSGVVFLGLMVILIIFFVSVSGFFAP